MDELKPCPHCNNKAEANYSSGAWIVGCIKEDCTLGFVETKAVYYEDAIVQWNTRLIEDELRNRIEELEKEVIQLRIVKHIPKKLPLKSSFALFLADEKTKESK